MPETADIQPTEHRVNPVALVAGIVIIAVLLAIALYLIVDLRGRVNSLEAGEQRAERGNKSD